MIDTTRYAGHTDAPWGLVDRNTIQSLSDERISSDQSDVCYLNEEAGSSKEEWFASPDSFCANARLIADAPLLLAEVERLREQVRIAEWALSYIAINRDDIAVWACDTAQNALAAMKAAGGC